MICNQLFINSYSRCPCVLFSIFACISLFCDAFQLGRAKAPLKLRWKQSTQAQEQWQCSRFLRVLHLPRPPLHLHLHLQLKIDKLKRESVLLYAPRKKARVRKTSPWKGTDWKWLNSAARAKKELSEIAREPLHRLQENPKSAISLKA